MEEEAGNKSEEELVNMTDDVLYNEDCLQKIALDGLAGPETG
jgi:hypothetical protein